MEWDGCVYEETYAWAFVQDFDDVAVVDGDTGGEVVGSKNNRWSEHGR